MTEAQSDAPSTGGGSPSGRSSPAPQDAARRQTAALSAFLLVQTVGTVFFVGDVIGDLREDPTSIHFLFEATVTMALVLGVLFGAFALRRTIELLRAQEAALDVARGALSDVIARQFHAWALTPAERDVAFLALKGLDVAEIAELRGAAQGTVRAQLTRIYSKAGVSGRAQFAAFFVEDLLGEGVGPAV
ncbi:MAG: helix-turn-helix transcriptional regulator [Rhodobacteraceae bacterium]|nr:helix-turn-helix transcriptional regulator [Paracoccaceae bacterium]